MDFRDDAQLDASQVEDRGGGGGRIPGGGLTIGGGAVGVIGLIIALLFGVNPANLTGGGDQPAAQPGSDLSTGCRTGEDADKQEKCRVVGVVNSVQTYWGQNLGNRYEKARTVLFTGSVDTGCGAATSDVGPFYCPADSRVYLDLGFFDQLESQFGAKGGPFAQAYVIGHEYGHHIQNLLGTNDKVGNDREGAQSASVRLELQADCYAGAWAKHAVDTGFYDRPFTDAEIKEALDAAQAVGDDRIQERSSGRIDPDSWTHGSSAQRVAWFTTGYQSGEPNKCDTFSGSI